MEIHQLDVSFTAEEIDAWLATQQTDSPLKVASFRSVEGGFTLQIKYNKITLPLRLKLSEASGRMLHFKILSLPALFSLLPLQFRSNNGIRLKGRAVSVDLVLASGGKIRTLEVEKLSFHQERVTVSVRNLLIDAFFSAKGQLRENSSS